MTIEFTQLQFLVIITLTFLSGGALAIFITHMTLKRQFKPLTEAERADKLLRG